jgi:succinyl-diaminopimelate desuccinylase
MRLVPDQEPRKIALLARSFLEELKPRGVEIEILDHHGAKPVIVSRDSEAVRKAMAAIERGFGRPPVFIREGGSIPVVNTFQEKLGAESLLLGLGLPDDNAHSPNEKFRIADFHRGMITMGAFLEEYAGAPS